MAQKKTKGKQKIEMKRIENDEDRIITFSKRRSGIYKKVNELVITCHAEVAFMVFSQAGTPFTYAHPSIEAVANRFMNPNHQVQRDNADVVAQAYRSRRIDELSEGYEKLVDALEGEKERQKVLEDLSTEDKYWWRAPVEELNAEEQRRVHDTFVELHDSLCDLLAQRLRVSDEGSSSSHQDADKPS